MTAPTLELHRADRVTIRVLGVLTTIATASFTVGTVFAGLRSLAAGETVIRLLTRAELPHEGTPGGPGIVSAGFDSALVTATGLSGGVRALLTSAMILDAVTVAAVGGAIAWFLLMFAGKRPFQQSLFRTTLIAGFALTLGPLLSTALSGFAKMQAAVELNPLAHEVFDIGFEIPALGVTIPLLGLAVLALAFVFRMGNRLQRDTEGLI